MVNPSCLVFVSMGDKSSLDLQSFSSEGLDVCVAYYGDRLLAEMPGVKYFLPRKGYKIANFLECLRVFPELLDYDYYYFLDDDLEISAETLRETVRLARHYHLDLCQPSLTRGSYTDWPHKYHRDGVILDYCNFIEIQCFCVSRSLLRLSLPYWSFFITGYGLDILFAHLLKPYRNKIAVLHTIQYVHPTREDAQTVRSNIEQFTSQAQAIERQLAFVFKDIKLLGNGFNVTTYETLHSAPLLPLNKRQRLYRYFDNKLNKFFDVLSESKRLVKKGLKLRVKQLLRYKPKYPDDDFTSAEKKCFYGSLQPHFSVLEYGSGQSTHSIAKLVSHITSVEHNDAWYQQVKEQVPSNVTLLFRPSAVEHTAFFEGGNNWNEIELAAFIAKDGTYLQFKDYIESPGGDQQYDIVLIDGRSRIYCVEFVARNNLLKPSGKLFIHDFDREWLSTAQLWFKLDRVVDRLGVFSHYES